MSDHTSAPTAPTSPTSIVYITSRWGEPSQTFVRREAGAVRAAGVAVSAASLKRPGPEGTDVAALWLAPATLVVGWLRAMIRSPGRVIGVYRDILARRVRLRNLASHLGAATIAIAWVGSGRLPAGHLHAQFGWVAASAAWAAARVDGRSFSVMLHAFEIHDDRYQDRFTAVPLQAASNVCVISERDRQIVADRWAVTPGIIRVTVNDRWLDTPPTVARENDLVVSVGRLVQKKGFEYLIDALAIAPGWRCVIVGDGPLHSALQARIDRHGIGNRVELAGVQIEDEILATMDRAAVFCLASVELPGGDRDGTPTVILEAMARGAAVIATDAGAIPEQVDGVGLMVAQRDATAIADALAQLTDPTLRADLATRARARVAREWSAAQSAIRLLERLPT